MRYFTLSLSLLLALIWMLPVPAGSAEDADRIRSLIAMIKTKRDSEGHYTAIELAKYKKEAVPLLAEGLKSPDASTRKWCSRALTNIVGGYANVSGRGDVEPAGLPLLAALAQESDEDVAWYMVQAVGKTLPDSKKAIPILVRVLSNGGIALQRETVATIGEYKAEAVPAKLTLIALLRDSDDDWLRGWTVNALRAIGLDKADAATLSGFTFPESGRVAADVLCALLDYPESAIDYLKANPGALEQMDSGNSLAALLRVLSDTSSKTSNLRNYLRKRADLPSIAMVHLGSEDFLPAIRSRIATADPHRCSFLQACARALGEKATNIVKISETDGGSFRPKSAHPGTDPARWASGGGHGDGSTTVLVTGSLLMSDRSPAVEPRFYHTNGGMLLGEQRKEPAPLLTYDHKTGRFAFFTTVFAAYSTADGQKEPGPYQTGSTRTLIEAKGAKPLTVHFYDEMPDVEITLSRSRKGETADQKTTMHQRNAPQMRTDQMPDPAP